MGVIFTTRGCNLRCNFCQTPVFVSTKNKIPEEEIERLIISYRRKGIKLLLFAEENFNPWENIKILKIIKSLKMKWFAETRFDYVIGRVKELVEYGFLGGIFGIESLSDEVLEFLNKKIKKEKIIKSIMEMAEYNIFIHGTYMFGHEIETVNSILKDINTLKNLPLLIYHVFVLTPLPRTPLYYYIEKKFGIFEKNWARFNCWHLVWNHPNISPQQMEKLVRYARSVGWGKWRFIKTGLWILKRVPRGIELSLSVKPDFE